MSIAESSTTRGHLRRILVLGLIVAAMIVAGAAGTMAYWIHAVDQMAAHEENALVARTIERRLNQISEDVASAAIWDDAYVNTQTRFDVAWVDENFGHYYADYLHHDRTVAFDRAGRLVYASSGGEMTSPGAATAFAAELKPLLDRVLAGEASLARAGAPKVGLTAAAGATGVIAAEGDIWLVALSTVTPENPRFKTSPGRDPIVVSAKRVSPVFLAALEQDLGVSHAELVPGDAVVDGPTIPLKDAAGKTLALLTWTPVRPGVQVFLGFAPSLAAALALIFTAGGLLAFRVNHALRGMTANDAALAQTLSDLTFARDRAEAASVAKSQFLANISHEIRTPLNGVLGMAQIMARGELDASQRERLAIIRESGDSLLSLLNDVLDLAKIEAGKLELARRPLDLAATIEQVCERFRPLATQKGLAFGFVVEPELHGQWMLDGLRVSQVVSNLLSNAVKFTSSGHVALRVWLGEPGIEIAVMDTGPGIPAKRIPELFGKFNQLDSSTTREFGGSGLGLAISHELLALMDGGITVDSRVGEGSCFAVRLPAERAPSAERAAA